ncbi:MAG: DNA-directed RNA polymerase subunit D [Candidatus Anstonellales archaeon]
MKVEIVKNTPERVELVFEDIPYYIANIIRRYCISGVPVYAIDSVVFYQNNSSFFDEYIAHRIGMIPIRTPKGSPAESNVGFYLDATGPKKVYSQELKSTDKEIVVAVENIPIVKLAEGQSIRLEGKLKKGIGRNHMKFQSGIASYEIVDDKRINFFCESLYHMDAGDVVKRAIDEIIHDLDSLEKEIEKATKKAK